MELAKVMAAIMEALNNDSEVIVRFESSEAKGLKSVVIFTDAEDGIMAQSFNAEGGRVRTLQDAIGLVVYYSRAITEVI